MKKTNHSKIILLILITPLYLLFYCTSSNGTPPKIDPSEIILNGSVIEFKQLPEQIKKDVHKIYRQEAIMYPQSDWMNMESFSIQSSFFISIDIDVKKYLILHGHQKDLQEALSKRPNFIYGKYWTRILLDDLNGAAIPFTRKFGGFHIFKIERRYRKDKTTIDKLLIGPIPKESSKIEIKMSNDAPSPKYNFRG